MLRKSGLLALTLGLFAAPLQAEEHSVLLMGQGYFPSHVYPTVGDTVIFENSSIVPMSATATDASWDSGVLQPGEQFTLEVTDGMTQTFVDSVTEGSLAEGVIEYAAAPPLELERNSEPNHASN